jgi:hypothetical protein
MKYNINENYNTTLIVSTIQNHLKLLNKYFLEQKNKTIYDREISLLQYREICGLSSFLTSYCYTFIKNNIKFKNIV